ncbi:hypothetical protein [Streptomyces arenae]|uniref:hypothetical protein n=1 Tax=Streptomyces arenae TaxID=29301 RepID=UPI00265ACE49|nr:hypothetical protein [Streptomyces arenae]MCG7203951.1 hypothetical protein [Streptomyces arenae]
MSWHNLLSLWPLIEADLHSEYGIDVDSGILRRRSWRWLQARIYGLLCAESRLQRHFAPPPEQPQQRRR